MQWLLLQVRTLGLLRQPHTRTLAMKDHTGHSLAGARLQKATCMGKLNFLLPSERPGALHRSIVPQNLQSKLLARKTQENLLCAWRLPAWHKTLPLCGHWPLKAYRKVT